MALRMSSCARLKSTISPLRTPRDFAWPRPTMLSAPASLISPTTAQTLEVPISNPTTVEERSNMFFPVRRRLGNADFGGNSISQFKPDRRNIIGDDEIQRREHLIVAAPEIEDAMPPGKLRFK